MKAIRAGVKRKCKRKSVLSFDWPIQRLVLLYPYTIIWKSFGFLFNFRKNNWDSKFFSQFIKDPSKFWFKIIKKVWDSKFFYSSSKILLVLIQTDKKNEIQNSGPSSSKCLSILIHNYQNSWEHISWLSSWVCTWWSRNMSWLAMYLLCIDKTHKKGGEILCSQFFDIWSPNWYITRDTLRFLNFFSKFLSTVILHYTLK